MTSSLSEPSSTRAFVGLAHEPSVGQTGVQQCAPRLSLAVFGHGLR